MRHEAQSTYAHQCPGAFGAAAGEAPAQGLFLLQGSHRQDAGSAEVRLCAMVFKGDKGIRATRVRHVHLAPHGAPVHAEDGLHLSVSGEGRKGAESSSREEMAGNGLPRHKEGGREKEAPSDGKSPESGRRGAPVGEEERAGICQAAIPQEGSALCR